MMHVPKLQPDKRTEVPELAAAAAVGTQDDVTSSEIHEPSEAVNAQRAGGWVSTQSTNSVATLGTKAHRQSETIWRHTVPI